MLSHELGDHLGEFDSRPSSDRRKRVRSKETRVPPTTGSMAMNGRCPSFTTTVHFTRTVAIESPSNQDRPPIPILPDDGLFRPVLMEIKWRQDQFSDTTCIVPRKIDPANRAEFEQLS